MSHWPDTDFVTVQHFVQRDHDRKKKIWEYSTHSNLSNALSKSNSLRGIDAVILQRKQVKGHPWKQQKFATKIWLRKPSSEPRTFYLGYICKFWKDNFITAAAVIKLCPQNSNFCHCDWILGSEDGRTIDFDQTHSSTTPAWSCLIVWHLAIWPAGFFSWLARWSGSLLGSCASA